MLIRLCQCVQRVVSNAWDLLHVLSSPLNRSCARSSSVALRPGRIQLDRVHNSQLDNKLEVKVTYSGVGAGEPMTTSVFNNSRTCSKYRILKPFMHHHDGPNYGRAHLQETCTDAQNLLKSWTPSDVLRIRRRTRSHQVLHVCEGDLNIVGVTGTFPFLISSLWLLFGPLVRHRSAHCIMPATDSCKSNVEGVAPFSQLAGVHANTSLSTLVEHYFFCRERKTQNKRRTDSELQLIQILSCSAIRSRILGKQAEPKAFTGKMFGLILLLLTVSLSTSVFVTGETIVCLSDLFGQLVQQLLTGLILCLSVKSKLKVFRISIPCEFLTWLAVFWFFFTGEGRRSSRSVSSPDVVLNIAGSPRAQNKIVFTRGDRPSSSLQRSGLQCLPQPWLSLDLHDCTLTKNGNDTGTVFRPVGSGERRQVGSLPIAVFDRSIVGEYQCHCFDHDGKRHFSRTVIVERKYSGANCSLGSYSLDL